MSITYDKHTTPVVFRVWKSGAVTALFPTMPDDTLGRFCVAYERLAGELSYDCDELMRLTLAAEPEQYAALAKRIKTVYGYNLEVVNSASDEMHCIRRRRAVRARHDAMASVTTVSLVRR